MVRSFSSYRQMFLIVICLILLWNLREIFQFNENKKIVQLNGKRKGNLEMNPDVCIINPDDPQLNRHFSCHKTKKILGLFSTTLCFHSSNDSIQNEIVPSTIWEESQLTRIIEILIRYPDLYLIDIGTNLGTYTMFTSGGMRRFTLAIDSYLPNLERIARAVQIENIQHYLVLVHNAIYFKSGEYITMENNYPHNIQLINNTQSKDHFIVKSIEFDDLLPILFWKGVHNALIEIDIGTSLSYFCQTGGKIFDQIDIQFVQMEWHSSTINHQLIIHFFENRQYIPTDQQCKQLQTSQSLTDWPTKVFWIKHKYFLNQTFC